MKVVAIIQARMGSSRLPGKILKEVNSKSLLAYQLERLQRCQTLDEVLIATTTKCADDEIVRFCKEHQVPVYRGSEDDVLSRYYEAAVLSKADVIVRITSDCPIIDPAVVDKVVQAYLDNPIYDYVSNTLERSYPRGMDTSLVPFETLKEIHEIAVDAMDREHVTRYIYQRPEQYRLLGVKHDVDVSEHRWTVDTSEDFELIKRILEALYPINQSFSLLDTLALLDKHPEWRLINAHIEQKKV